MSGDVDEVVRVVRSALESNGTLSGTRVAEVVRRAVPGFQPAAHGFQSLREFVLARVTGVAVVARKGMDVVYGFGSATTEVPADLWRVWASPNSPRLLAVRVQDGHLRAVARATPPLDGEALVAPPSTSFHQDVARQFLPQCEEPLRTTLTSILDASAVRWWDAWNKALANGPELARWHERRKTALLDEFRSSLQKAGVGEASVLAAVSNVLRSHEGQDRGERAPRGTIPQGTMLRDLVLKAVRGLGENELREIRLPVGAVVDALRELGVLR